MRPAVRIMLCLAAAAFASGCARQLIAGDPNPPPPPGYVVICYSSPGLFADFATACKPVIVPEETVLRARG